MAHAGAKAAFQAAVQVAQGFGHGLGEFGASGNQRSQRGRQGVTRAHKGGFQTLKFFAAQHIGGRAQHVVNELVGQVDARYQRVGHAKLLRCHRQIEGAGRLLLLPVGQEPACQGAVVAHQHRGLGQHDFSAGVQVLVDLVVLPPGQIGHVSHHRHVRPIGQQRGNRAEVVWVADKADLEDIGRHVFQNRAGLAGDGLVVKRVVVDDFAGVAHIGTCDHRHGMHPDRGQRHRVCCQTTGTTGVIGVEHHDAGHGAVHRIVVELFQHFNHRGGREFVFRAFHGFGK